jgi:hypothetical protein
VNYIKVGESGFDHYDISGHRKRRRIWRHTT